MSGPVNKYISRANRAVVREVLMQEWDPIGVGNHPGAEDEYDSYVGEVYVMLMDEESKQAIVEYFMDIAVGHMGLTPSADLVARSERAAEKLVTLRPSFRAN
jgi:hypothetical protein